jgi:hypothetical protein
VENCLNENITAPFRSVALISPARPNYFCPKSALPLLVQMPSLFASAFFNATRLVSRSPSPWWVAGDENEGLL